MLTLPNKFATLGCSPDTQPTLEGTNLPTFQLTNLPTFQPSTLENRPFYEAAGTVADNWLARAGCFT